jgi:hypothetical protein
MSREALSDGYVELMTSLYEPEAFFRRVDDLYLHGGFEIDRAWRKYASRRPWLRTIRHLKVWLEAFGILTRLLMGVPDEALRRIYRRQFWQFLRARRGATSTRAYAIKCAVHYHMHRMVGSLAKRDQPIVNTF